jgi:hypothetical protein
MPSPSVVRYAVQPAGPTVTFTPNTTLPNVGAPLLPRPSSVHAPQIAQWVAQPAAAVHNALRAANFTQVAQARNSKMHGAQGALQRFTTTVINDTAQGAARARSLGQVVTGPLDTALAMTLGVGAASLVHGGTAAGYTASNVLHAARGQTAGHPGLQPLALSAAQVQVNPAGGERTAAVTGGAAALPALILIIAELLLSAAPKLGIAGAGGILGVLIGLLHGSGKVATGSKS